MMSLSLSLSSPFAKHQYRGCVAAVARDFGERRRYRKHQHHPLPEGKRRREQILICNGRILERRRVKTTTTVYAKVTTSSSSSSSSSENVGETTQSLNVNAKRGKILLEKWSQKTQSFAELATVPLLAVTLPQILLNQQNIVQGNSHLLAGISYEGYACGCLGNLLLLSYFSAIDEPAGRNIQAIGVVNTVFLLSQLFFTGNCGDVNLATYAACVSVALFGVFSAYFKKKMFSDPTARENACALYERALGVVGYTFVPYILSHALFKTSTEVSQMLALGAFAIISLRCANDYFGWSEKKNVNFFALEQFMKVKWQTLMGWTATLLFSLLPIAQISTSTTDPSNIASLSLVAVVLGGAGNALMFARAWHIRDWCWSLGSFGGSAVGSWGVLLTMFNYGHKQVSWGVFAALSALYWGWVAFVMWYDDQCKKKANI